MHVTGWMRRSLLGRECQGRCDLWRGQLAPSGSPFLCSPICVVVFNPYGATIFKCCDINGTTWAYLIFVIFLHRHIFGSIFLHSKVRKWRQNSVNAKSMKLWNNFRFIHIYHVNSLVITPEI